MMKQPFRRIEDTAGFDDFRELLRSCDLPADDLDYQRDFLIGYYENDQMVGTGGLEIHGPYALLRSLSVKLGIRGKAVGSVIAEHLLRTARERNLRAVYLLTETAPDFFRKKGFRELPREDVPGDVRASGEFSQVCPDTAVAMCLSLA